MVYLNWLDSKGLIYEKATNIHLKAFIDSVVYGDLEELKVKSIDAMLTYSTLNRYITVITDFYRWLDDNGDF